MKIKIKKWPIFFINKIIIRKKNLKTIKHKLKDLIKEKEEEKNDD